jgi:hypothetical protein
MSATNPRNQRYMRLFAYLPVAFHPAAKDVLLLCYGCGVTVDAFTLKSTMERIDAVDISKEVFALADFMQASITQILCEIRACTPSSRTGASFYKPAHSNTTSSLANRLRRKSPVR